jgi:hypothetical protein
MGRKRKKKQMMDRPKEKEKIMKEIKKTNMRVHNKGWRYKDALKRKRFKAKEQKNIMRIYQIRIKYMNERRTPMLKAIRKTAMEKKKRQNEEVRAWRNPHELFALAMLRNFILLLKHKRPEEKEKQGKYGKIREKRIDGIYKEMEKRKDKMEM